VAVVGGFLNFSTSDDAMIYKVKLYAIECGCETLTCPDPPPASDEFRIEAWTKPDGGGTLIATRSPDRAVAPFTSEDYRLIEFESRSPIRSLRLVGLINCAYFDEMTVDTTPPPPPVLHFLRGDCNGDGGTGSVTDAVYQLSYTFLGGEEPGCKAACDHNGDGGIDLADAVYLLSRNFLGGPALPAPYPDCGSSEANPDIVLGCETPGCD
jgi:hypothetical protein